MVGEKKIPQTIAIFISIFGVTLFFGTVIYLLFTQIIEFSNEWHILKVKLLETANQLSFFLAERFDLSSEKQMTFLKNVFSNSGTQAISLLKTTLYSLSESVFYLLIIPVYSALILYYRELLVNVLYHIFPFAVGKRLKINTLVIILVVVLGCMFWGAAGMILFIPFVSIAKLIAERTESLKTLTILLGDGEIKKTKGD